MSNQIVPVTEKRMTELRQVARSEAWMTRFTEVVGQSNAGAYISSALLAVLNNKQLQECTYDSIMVSALRAATLRLSVDPSTGQAHLVPFKGVCTFVIGYKGIKQLAMRTGKYRFINEARVYNDQDVMVDQITGDVTIQGLSGVQRTHVIGYLSAFELTNGFRHVLYMTKQEILEHAQKYSKTYRFDDSPWHKEEEKMCLKTVVRLNLLRNGYLDPNDLAVLSTEDSEDEQPSTTVEWIEDEKPQEKKTEAQLLGELGFTPEPKPENKPPVRVDEPYTPKMTLETAELVTNSEGVRYGDIELDKINHMANSLRKMIEKNGITPNDKAEKQYKLDACLTILRERAK